MIDPAIAQRGKGILRTFNEAGVVTAADVHVASRLSVLGGERDETVLLAAALAVRAVRSGSVCLDLLRVRDVTVDDPDVDVAALPWPDDAALADALAVSPLVVGSDAGPLTPLRLVATTEGPLLYLDRYHRQEQAVRAILAERDRSQPEVDTAALAHHLDRLFVRADGTPTAPPDRQRIASALAATRYTTVVAGGPGTGKTHTVARILALVRALDGPDVRIGLAAPTGKAAARLQESVREQIAGSGSTAGLDLPPDLEAKTLHRLLGWQRVGSTRFRYHAGNRLPYDLVVVDETSMVSLTMMSHLLEAVRPDARLVLVGDPDQLTSVDAGAVLADLVLRPVEDRANPVAAQVLARDLDAPDDPDEKALGLRERERLRNGVVRLSRGRRFGGDIAELAVAVRAGEVDTVLALLRASDQVRLVGPDDLAAVRSDVVTDARAVTAAAADGRAGDALAAFERHRLLCAHREGPFGVGWWQRQALEWIGDDLGRRLDPRRWYVGQPLMVTENDYETKIFNGDTGVVVRDADGELSVAFARGAEPFLVHPSRLPSAQTVYATTIHRSQGSQFDTVTVILPDDTSSLLTRELLYTAITRARRHVRLVGTEESVRAGVARGVQRASGLRRTLIEPRTPAGSDRA